MIALAEGMRSGWSSGVIPGARAWYPEVSLAEPEAVVHLVDFAADTLAELSDVFADAGMATRACSHLELLADAHLSDFPGCVMLHARCGEIGDLDFLADFQRGAKGVPIVLAVDRADARTVMFAIKGGAIGFVERPFPDRDVLEAVQFAIRVDQTRRQTEARSAELRRCFRSLTPREREVMALVTEGRLNKQAAFDLGLSEITVKAHRGSVMRKMAARTLADLVRMADLLASLGDAEAEIFRSRR